MEINKVPIRLSMMKSKSFKIYLSHALEAVENPIARLTWCHTIRGMFENSFADIF
jgi:hypothetical protein